MKQHITSKDLEMLTEKGKTRLYRYASKSENIADKCEWLFVGKVRRSEGTDELPLLSIGQMIEFLDTNEKITIWKRKNIDNKWLYSLGGKPSVELCDALWQACIEVLNKE